MKQMLGVVVAAQFWLPELQRLAAGAAAEAVGAVLGFHGKTGGRCFLVVESGFEQEDKGPWIEE